MNDTVRLSVIAGYHRMMFTGLSEDALAKTGNFLIGKVVQLHHWKCT
jgi:hypothetical protein